MTGPPSAATAALPRLRLLGAPAFESESGIQVFAAERGFQLLSLLAHRGEWLSRDQLAALFWPAHSADAARRNLRKVLFRLRESQAGLFAEAPLEEQRGTLRWPVATDLQAFERLAAGTDAAAALALWQGEAWQGMDAELAAPLADWLAIERQRLRGRWRDLLLADALATPDPARMLACAERALGHDPLDEEALRLALRGWIDSGRRAEAVNAYQAYSRRLAEALGLEPDLQTRALLADEPRSTAAADRPAVARDDTAAPARDAFVGRQVEQRELAALIAQAGGRWVTLVGPGGIGKSRLLAEALPALGARHADGGALVPLEDLTSADQVAARIAETLGIALTGDADADAQLAAALKDSDRLVALDNLEHLLPAVPGLAGLLERCPGLRFVVTSRVRAGAAGEWLMPLAGLPFPDVEDADRADAFDAVRLFVQRARESQPRFDLRAERASVVELCAFVEGMPLALELAAVWTRHFRVAEIVRELRSGGELLHEPMEGTTLPARQRSMAATFEHSWQLLVPAEREMLAALAVFRGGFTREAVRAVAGGSLALLAALVDKSLVRRDDASGPIEPVHVRFGLHPLVQEFAREKLDRGQAGEGATARRRHAEYFAQLLGRLPGAGRPAERNAYVVETRADLDNVAAAWRWAVEEGRTDLLGTMVTPLRILHYSAPRWAEGLALLELAEPLLVARELRVLPFLDLSRGILEYAQGRYGAASESLRRALRGLRRADRRSYRNALAWLGQALIALGRTEAARHCLEQGLASAREDRDPSALTDCLGNLGGLDYTLGRFDSAIGLMQEALELRLATGGDSAMLLNNLGLAQLHAGRPALAVETLERGLEASRREHNHHARAFLPFNLAQACFALGDLARSEARTLESSQAIADGVAPVLAISNDALRARIALARGDVAAARSLLAGATRAARERRIRPLELGLAICWAEWLQRSGDPERARLLLGWALAQPDLEHPDRMLGDEVAATLAGAEPPPAAATAAQIEALLDALLASR